MHIDVIGSLSWYIQIPVRPEGWVLLGLYLLITVFSLFYWRRTFTRLPSRRWWGFIALALIAIVLCVILIWSFPIATSLPLPDSPQRADIPATPLLSSVVILLAVIWLDIGPALVVSLLSGVLLAGFYSGQFTLRFEVVALAILAGYWLRQNYHGRVNYFLRQPIIIGPLAALMTWPLMLFAFYAYMPGDTLPALNTAWLLFLSSFWPTMAAGLIAGGVAQLSLSVFPNWRLPLPAPLSPPWARSLNRRMLFTFIPFGALLVIVLVYAVSATALSEARQQAIDQMSHDALSAAREVPNFLTMGQGLIHEFSMDDQLNSPDRAVRETRLASVVRIGPFFDELLEFNAAHQLIAAYNQGQDLTPEEQLLISRTLLTSAPQTSGVFALGSDSAISFIDARLDPKTGQPQGAVLGRARIQRSVLITLLQKNLQNTLGAGVGYLIDRDNRIIVHPNPALTLTPAPFAADLVPTAVTTENGKAYEDHAPNGAPRLLFIQPIEGTDNWSVVIEVPFDKVLQIAAEIFKPLLGFLLLLGMVATVVLSFFTRAITRPVHQLSAAAGNIARGQLDRPIVPSGQDEVGQLGSAFEQMRQSLKGRLDDLSLLLRVSQTVSSSLDLERGVPPLLSGALQATPARVARLVLLSDSGSPEAVLTSTESPAVPTALDKALVTLTAQNETPLLIDNVTRARSRAALEPNLIGPGIKAIAALPVRRQTKPIGLMWLGYAEAHDFTESEVNVLGTLAGQAAVLIENAKLFLAAEGGRRRLQAVLTSTSDAVIVTDKENRVLLCNPAAEFAFGLAAGSAVGQAVSKVWPDATLERLLKLEDGARSRTEEIVLPDGRTLFGSASGIISSDGQMNGRVVVLRDITHLKELDAMKSEFVATVSHDLRAPLTYMRGYTTMLPMVGTLSPKQQDYLEKIMLGIEQMTELIDDLLDLGRIEAGIGLVRNTCSLAEVARSVVDTLQGQAGARGVKLVTGKLSPKTIEGDQGLVHHAVMNLVDNAIKYTTSGGTVTVSVDEGDNYSVIAVKDTGFGIAPGDQARLFERFYRVRRRETIDIKGTGLGLAIVKSIADWHHGRVWVESQIGIGSTFYLLLPVNG
jgi:PAS domain S-box-containing protein